MEQLFYLIANALKPKRETLAQEEDEYDEDLLPATPWVLMSTTV